MTPAPIWVLLITLNGQPLNHEPYHEFATLAECQGDQRAFNLIAPEWNTQCEMRPTRIPKEGK